MKILLLFLGLLKIIGMLLLAVLALILLFLFIILFAAVRYRLEAQKEEDIRASADVSWLFGSLKIHFFMADGQASYYVKFLWLTLLDSEREKKEKKKRKSLFSGKRKRKGKSADTSPNTDKSTQPQMSAKGDAGSGSQPSHRAPSVQPVKKPVPEQETVSAEIVPEGKSGADPFEKEIKEEQEVIPFSKLQVRRIKMSDIKEEAPEEREEKRTDRDTTREETKEEINLDYFKKMPLEEKKRLISACVTFLKRVLRHVMPEDFVAEGELGMEDPALTGYLIGAVAVLKGAVFHSIYIKANFHEQVLRGKVIMRGKIRLVSLFYAAVRLALERPVRKIIRIYLKG